MNSLVLINEKENLRTDYNLKDIEKISYGKMKDFLNTNDIINNGYKINESANQILFYDIINNGYKINESAIQILFYDNTLATYGKDWHIEFRTF